MLHLKLKLFTYKFIFVTSYKAYIQICQKYLLLTLPNRIKAKAKRWNRTEPKKSDLVNK